MWAAGGLMDREGAAKRRMLSLAERPVLGAREEEPLAPFPSVPEAAAGIVKVSRRGVVVVEG